MKKILFIAAFLLVGLGFAQTPAQIASAVFERVYANEVGCYDASVVMGQAFDFDYNYCGVIGDTITTVNKDWSIGVYSQYGYTTIIPWKAGWVGDFGSRFENHMTGLTNGTYNSVISLTIITDGYTRGTLITLHFDRR